MDQFISCYGQPGHALRLDCRSLEFRAVPIPRPLALVVVNSMVKHSIAAATGYNTRRQECEEAVHLLQRKLPAVASLRDLGGDELEQNRGLLPDTLYRRCRHIVTENARVQHMAAALEQYDLHSIAQHMAASHQSMRDDYEITCPEIDRLVQIAEAQPGAFGARMMGGGFGGCTIQLVVREYVDSFIAAVREEYQACTGIAADVYHLEAAAGAESARAAGIEASRFPGEPAGK